MEYSEIVHDLYQIYRGGKSCQHKNSSNLPMVDDGSVLIQGNGWAERPSSVPKYETEATPGDPDNQSWYNTLIRETPSYKWLLSAVFRTQMLQIPDQATEIHNIKEQLLEGMWHYDAMGRYLPAKVEVEFAVDWDFRTFYTEQGYSESPGTVFETAITLAGNDNSVQAATCIDYVRQTWGAEGGELLLYLQQTIINLGTSSKGKGQLQICYIESVVSIRVFANRKPPDPSTEDWTHTTLSNATRIKSRWNQTRLILAASGISYCVAELGDQLAWLSTALASSKDDGSITYSRPQIRNTKSLYERTLDVLQQNWVIQHERAGLRSYCDNDASGGCWQGLFRNPVVVQGYPIPRRIIANSGLEVSFDLMATLSNTQRLVDFDGRTFLKGFSTMAAITKIVGNTIWWHLCLNEDKGYISFEDYRMPHNEETECIVDVVKLSASRHILGWSTRVKHMAGESRVIEDRQYCAQSLHRDAYCITCCHEISS